LNKNAKNRQKDNRIKEYNYHDNCSSANNEGNSIKINAKNSPTWSHVANEAGPNQNY